MTGAMTTAAMAMRATNSIRVIRMYPRSVRRLGFGMGWSDVTLFTVSRYSTVPGRTQIPRFARDDNHWGLVKPGRSKLRLYRS